jgi:hypothetical protein
MVSHVDFFRVGRADEIRELGWVKVHLMGWEVVILAWDKEFVAIELGQITARPSTSFLADDCRSLRSGAVVSVGKFLRGPSGTIWGQLRNFPVRIEDEFVLVGVVH